MGEDRPPDQGEDSEEPRPPETSGEVSDADPAPESAATQAYHQRARLAEDRLAEVLAGYRKLKTDNEGHKDRITRNLDRKYEQRRGKLLQKFIDILDNLDRALEAAQLSYAGEPLLEGMILVRTQILQALQGEGLERIPVIGLPFDPHLSESVGTEPVADPERDHIVVRELMRGYRLNGRIARASTVIIGVYMPSEISDEEPTGPPPAIAGMPGPVAVPTRDAPPFEVPVVAAREVVPLHEALADSLPQTDGVLQSAEPPVDPGQLGPETLAYLPPPPLAPPADEAYLTEITDGDAGLVVIEASSLLEEQPPQVPPAAEGKEDEVPAILMDTEIPDLEEVVEADLLYPPLPASVPAPAPPPPRRPIPVIAPNTLEANLELIPEDNPGEISLEEIIAHAEAQEALFPGIYEPEAEAVRPNKKKK